MEQESMKVVAWGGEFTRDFLKRVSVVTFTITTFVLPM